MVLRRCRSALAHVAVGLGAGDTAGRPYFDDGQYGRCRDRHPDRYRGRTDGFQLVQHLQRQCCAYCESARAGRCGESGEYRARRTHRHPRHAERDPRRTHRRKRVLRQSARFRGRRWRCGECWFAVGEHADPGLCRPLLRQRSAGCRLGLPVAQRYGAAVERGNPHRRPHQRHRRRDTGGRHGERRRIGADRCPLRRTRARFLRHREYAGGGRRKPGGRAGRSHIHLRRRGHRDRRHARCARRSRPQRRRHRAEGRPRHHARHRRNGDGGGRRRGFGRRPRGLDGRAQCIDPPRRGDGCQRRGEWRRRLRRVFGEGYGGTCRWPLSGRWPQGRCRGPGADRSSEHRAQRKPAARSRWLHRRTGGREQRRHRVRGQPAAAGDREDHGQ